MLALLYIMLGPLQALANPAFTYTGRILDSNGSPVVANNVRFTVTIYDSLGQCWLYTEQRQLDLSNTAGTFSFDIGSNDGTLIPLTAAFNNQISPTGVKNMADVFNNIKTFDGLGNANSCSGTFTPNPSNLGAGRYLAVYFSVSGGPDQALPMLKINPVPSALTVGGYGTGELLKIDSSVNPSLNNNTNNGLNQTQYDEFWRLVKNPLSAYLPPSGDVTVVSGNNKVTSLLGQALPAGPATSGQVLVSNGTAWVLQSMSSGSVTSVSANAPLSVGGTASAPVISLPAATTSADGYLKSADWNTFNGKQSSSLANGSVWIGNSSGVAEAQSVSGDATLAANGSLTLATTTTAATKGTAQKVPQITYDAKGRITSVTEVTVDDTTKLPLAGGTMTGPIAMGAQDLTNTGNITMAANKYLTLSDNATPGSVAGQIWYNAGKVFYWNGSTAVELGVAGAGITSLNGLTAGTQTFAIGTSGNAPAFSSSTSTHTLNIPMASSGASVTAGLLSNAEYAALNAKQTSSLSSGKVWVGNASGLAQEQTLSGDIASVSNAGAVTVDKTTLGQSSKILALDGSGVANMYGAGIKGTTSGTVTLQSNANTATYSLTLPNVAPAAGESLQSDASGNLSWVTALGAVSDTATLTSGKIWVGNASNKSSEVSVSGDATLASDGTLTLATTTTAATKGTAQKVPQVTYDAKGRITSVTEVTIDDNTKLPLAGGTMTGPIAMGAQDITNTGNITMAANKYLTLSDNATAGSVAGQIWYNAGKVYYWNGSSAVELGVAGSGITSFNGSTVSIQSLAVPGTSGTAPNWSTNTGTGVHTLNIPMASTATVTAGLLSKTDYDRIGKSESLNGKAFDTTAASTMGQILYFDSAADKWKVSAAAAPTDGQVMKWNNTSKAWEPGNDSAGWTAVDASYAAKGIVQFQTDAATSGVNVASGVATVVRTTTGQNSTILSLDGSGIANMYAAGIKGATSGIITLQAPTTTANYSLTLPNVAPAAGQSLQSDASGNLSWATALTTITDTASLTSGKIWVGNASNKSSEVSVSGDATLASDGTLTLATTTTAATKGTAQKVPQITYDAKGRITSVTEVSIDDNTKLPLAGGTMTGPIAMGAQDLTNTGNISMAANKYLGLSANSTDGTVAGQMWYDAGTIKYFDGSSVKSLGVAGAGITNFNGSSVGSQSLATPGTSGNAPNWSTNTGTGVHTLNIPLASSGASVTAGLLSNAEYVALDAKQSSSLASAKVWVGNASGVAQEQTLSGDIASVSNTGSVTIDKTQTAQASKILQLDASSVAVTKGVNVGGAGSGVASLRYPNTATNTTLILPGSAGSANQVLQTDGAGLLSWATVLSSITDTASLTSGKIWVGNASNKSSEVSISGDATLASDGTLTLATTTTAATKGTAQKVPQITYDAKGRITSVTEVSIDDNTKLPLAGGTMTGPIAMGAQDLTNTGNISMAANKYLTLSDNATPGSVAGQIWYNAGKVYYWNGSSALELGVAGAGITSLNGLTAGTQTFAIGTSGNAPAFSSNTSTHTLNIPMASSGASVTAGLLSNAEYSALNAKQSSSLSSAKVWVGNASGVAQEQTLSGDIASVSNAGAVTVDKTTLGQSSKILALDGSGVANMYGAGIKGATSGTVTLQAPPTTATYSLALPNVAPAAGESLQSDASGNLSWVSALTAITNTATLTSGKIWIGNASNKSIEATMGGDATLASDGTLTLATTTTAATKGTAQKVPQVTYDAKGRITSVTEVTIDDNTKLPLAGGTMTGPIAMGAQDLTNTGNITMAANKYFTLSANSTNGTTAGQMWYDSGTIKYYDGSSVKSLGVVGTGITNFNGSTVVSQSLATPGTSGTAPNWSTNTGTGVHTLNIPMASTAAVTAGLLSKTDYDRIGKSESLNGKAFDTTAASTMGQILYFDSAADKWKVSTAAAPTDGQVMKWNNTSKAWEPGTDSAGWTAVDASYAAKGIVQFQTDAATSGVNVASGVATVVRTTTGQNSTILSLDGSGIANMYAAGIKGATSGTVTLQAPTTTANYSLTLPNVAPAAGQSLQSDASGNLSWVSALTSINNSASLTSNKIWVGNASNLAVETDPSTLFLMRDGSVAMTGSLKMGGNTIYGNSTASGNLTLESTSNATKGYILLNPNGGNVGIGTATPVNSFDVAANASVQGWAVIGGTAQLDSAVSNPKLTVRGNLLIENANTVYYNAGVRFTCSETGCAGNSGTQRLFSLTNSNGYKLSVNTTSSGSTFNTNGNASIGSSYVATAAPTNGLIVEGNVGIGATSPATKLDVSGVTRSTGVDLNSTYGGSQVSVRAPAAFTSYTLTLPTSAGSANQVLSTDGSGTLSWLSALTAVSNSAGLTSNNIWVGNASNIATVTDPSTLFAMKGGQAGAFSLGTTDASQLTIKTNNSDRLILDSSGYIGVNQATPTATLDILTTAVPSMRENPLRVMVSDASADSFGVKNATNGDTKFIPTFYGSVTSDSTQPSLNFQAMTVAANDTGTNPLLIFNMQRHNGDPVNGVFSPITSRDLLSIRNQGSPVFIIQADGDVGIGTTTPTAKLSVKTTATSGDIATFTSTGTGGAGCSIAWNGTSCSSDIRLKDHIATVDSSVMLGELMKTRPVHYAWKKDPEHKMQTGFIAQELEKIFPEFVTTNGEGYKQVNYAHFVSVLTSSIQELFKRSQSQDQEITALKEENARMKAYLCGKDPSAPFCSQN